MPNRPCRLGVTIHQLLEEEKDTAGETRGNVFGQRRRGVRANSVRRGDLYSSLAHEDSREDLRCRIRREMTHRPAAASPLAVGLHVRFHYAPDCPRDPREMRRILIPPAEGGARIRAMVLRAEGTNEMPSCSRLLSFSTRFHYFSEK